jgi:hypothetical protein
MTDNAGEWVPEGSLRHTEPQQMTLPQRCYGQQQGTKMQIPQRFLKGLGPYQSLSILAVPLAIVEPLKLVALFVVGGGHFIAGVLVMICAYAGSLFITERLFVVLKPKLLTLLWFAVAWQWFVAVRDKLIYGLRRTWTRLRRNMRRVAAGTPKAVSALIGKSHLAHCLVLDGTDTQ